MRLVETTYTHTGVARYARTAIAVTLLATACAETSVAPTPPDVRPAASVVVAAYVPTDISEQPEESFAMDVNGAGDVAITSYPDSGGQFAILRRANGQRVNLGALPGGVGAIAEAINSAREVVGFAYNSQGAAHAFLWRPGEGMKDLGPGPRRFSLAYGINDRGDVVGEANFESGITHAFLWTKAAPHLRDLGTLGGSFGASSARDISDAGVIVGWSSTPTGVSHAVLYDPAGGTIDLGTLGGTFSIAWGINNSREVVGMSETTSGEDHAFYWSTGTSMVDLGTFGGRNSIAFDINDRGQVVGQSEAGTTLRAFTSNRTGPLVDIGDLGGALTRGLGINRFGTLVGSSTTPSSGSDRATLWSRAGAPK